MKTSTRMTMRKKSTIVKLLAGVLVLAVGCGSEPSEQTETPASQAPAEENIPAMTARLVAAIESATELTSIDVGNPPERVPLRIARTEPTPAIPRAGLRDDFPAVPQGLLVASLSSSPKTLAVRNDGVIITGHEDAARAWPVAAGAPARVLAQGPVVQTQLDASGERLLLQTTESVSICSADSFEPIAVLQGAIPSGRSHWYRDGELLFVNERIVDFSASSEQRVYTTAMIRGIDESSWSRPPFRPGVYASLGTLPCLQETWAVPLLPHQVNPMPGPLVRINDDGSTSSLTATSEWADVSPSADQRGDLVLVRTWRHGGAQARAHLQWADSITTPTLQWTSEPTRLVAISPSGEWLAAVVEPAPGLPELRRVRRADIEASFAESVELHAREEDLRRRVAALRAEMEGELKARVGAGDPLAGPSREVALDLGRALAGAIERHLRVPLPKEPIARLAAIDGLLAEIRDYLPEDPALLQGLGGLVAEALPDAHWVIEAEDVGLTPDVGTTTFGDDLTFLAMQPFGAARAALAGEFVLAVGTASALRSPLPIYLVENRMPATFERIQRDQLLRAGIDPEKAWVADLSKRLGDARGDLRALHAFVYTKADSRGDRPLARRALVPLVESDPSGARAVGMLARNLYDDFHPTEAEKLYRLAVMLDPANAELRFRWAGALMAEGLHDEAEAEFLRSGRLDTAGELSEHLPGRLELLAKLRAEKPDDSGRGN